MRTRSGIPELIIDHFLTLEALAVASRVAGSWGRSYLERKLDALPGLMANVGDVRLRMSGLGVDLTDVSVAKRENIPHGTKVRPFASARRVSVRPSWLDIKDRVMKGFCDIDEPCFTLDARRSPGEAGDPAAGAMEGAGAGFKARKDTTAKPAPMFPAFLETYKDLSLFTTLRRGEIHVLNIDGKTGLDFDLTGIEGSVTCLRGSGRFYCLDTLRASLAGVTTAGGAFTFQLDAIDTGHHPDFHMSIVFRDLELAALNGFIAHFGKLNVASGRASLSIDVRAGGGKYTGETRIALQNLRLFDATEQKEGRTQSLKERLLDGMRAVLEDSQGRIAPNARFSGTFKRQGSGVWGAVGEALAEAGKAASNPQMLLQALAQRSGGVA